MTASIEQATQQRLSPSEQQRLQATSNSNKRREFLLSRALMRHALDDYIKPQQQDWQFVEQPSSPPIITNLPAGLHFSLTHSKGCICFALADCPLGIDIEKMRGNRDFIALAQSSMNEQEVEFLAQHPERLSENFYRFWCAKEACYKALPLSEQYGVYLKNVAVMKLLEGNDGEYSELITQKNADFMLAVALQKKPSRINYKHFPKNDTSAAELAESFETAPVIH